MSEKPLHKQLKDDLTTAQKILDAIGQAAEVMGRSEERLRLALDAGRMGVWEVDETTGIGHMDETNAALLGFPADTREVRVRDFLAKVHADDRPVIERRVAQAKIKGNDYSGEYRVVLPDGQVRWIASRGRFVYSSDGNPLRLVGVKYDITQRKQAELAMRTWQQTFERSEFAIALGDNEGKTLIVVNPAFARMHGWSAEELTGKQISAVFAPEEHGRVRDYIEAANGSSHYTWESKHIRKDGAVFPVQIDATPIRDEAGNVVFRTAYVQDISVRKLAEANLRESEQRFHAIFDGAFEFIGLLKPDGTLMEANQTALEYIGAPAAEVVGRAFWETPWWRGSPQQQERLKKAIAEAAQGKFVRFEAQHPSKDGQIDIIDFSVRPITDDTGRVTMIIPEGRRITERKRAEQALGDSEQRLQHALDAGGMGTWERELRTGEIKWDPRVYQMCGIEVGTKVNKDVLYARIHPDDLSTLTDAIEHTVATGGPYQCDFRFLRPDGKTVWIQGRGGLWRDASGAPTHIVGVNFDVTERKLAEEALRQGEERFRAIADYTYDWESWIGVDGRPIWINPEVKRFTGRSADECLRMPDYPLPIIHEYDRERMSDHFRNALIGMSGNDVSFRIRHKNGDEVWGAVSWQPIFNADGARLGYRSSVRDITDRIRAEQSLRESEERLTQAVHAAEIGIYEHDHRSGQLYWSPILRQIYGVKADEPASLQGFVDLLHPEERDLVLAASRQAYDPAGEGLYCVEHRLVRRDGSVRWVYARSQTLFTGEGVARHRVRTVGAVVDVTERKQLESELRKRVEQLGEADRRKDEFLATLAHELRNPLAPIRNVINLLGKKGAREPEVERAHDVISRQITHLTRLIDDLLDVSRITRDKLELRKQRVTLAEVIDAAVEISRPLIERNEHNLTIGVPPETIYLEADTVRLSQVFMNLLNNAAKYTPKGGRIALRAECDGAQVKVQIVDNGIGIAADQLSRLFDMFYQADRTYDQSQGGLGIGLTLVQRLVQMHGGTVEAHSAGLNQGSEFVVRLPVLATPSDAQSETGVLDNVPSAARRILVVDDYGDSADTLAELLGFDGNDVRVAHDGLEALEVAEKFRPDVALLDLGMPKLNGYETASRIREQPWGKDVFLVAVTGWGEQDVMERTMEAGFDAHVLKPVDYPELSKLLAEYSIRDGPDDLGDA